mmetsp:Transcript_54111/g.161985  ORF Transcript_54111/g.161985 Transcript_54111/m.161985 type:complete len:107 (-) Transcript_54111:420-740(-)
MKTAAAAILALAASASAFAPVTSPAFRQTTVALNAEKNEMNLDDNFDDVNLVRIMGLNRIKKIQRRHKREMNERVRNSEIVQGADGEWAEATAEQTAEMKAAAKEE